MLYGVTEGISIDHQNQNQNQIPLSRIGPWSQNNKKKNKRNGHWETTVRKWEEKQRGL